MAVPREDARVSIARGLGRHDLLLAVVAFVVGIALALVVGMPELTAPPLDVSVDPAGLLAPL